MRVEPSTPRSSRELGEFTGRQRGVARSVELGQLLDHHGARWHVDPERQRFRGKHHLDETLGEAGLDRFFEGRDHTGVVGCDPVFQAGKKCRVVESLKIARAEACHFGFDDGADLGTLFRVGQPNVCVQTMTHGFVATRPTEDEIDGW